MSSHSTSTAGTYGRHAAAEPAGRDLLWFLAEGTAGAVGEEFFRCLVRHVALALRADVAFVAEVVPEDRERARFLACWQRGRLAERFEYCMAGTPCAEVGDSTPFRTRTESWSDFRMTRWWSSSGSTATSR